MEKLNRAFYAQDTVAVARALLGKELVRVREGRQLVVRITETEAYVGRIDKACHAYGYRRTQRTETLFGPPGTAYIYFIYGMYHCLNFVTEPEGEPCAVLIRAGEAVAGKDDMALARFGKPFEELTAYQRKNLLNGPGKLCQALGLTRKQNGMDLLGDELYVRDAGFVPDHICQGKRINIDYAQEAVDFPWRFWI